MAHPGPVFQAAPPFTGALVGAVLVVLLGVPCLEALVVPRRQAQGPQKVVGEVREEVSEAQGMSALLLSRIVLEDE